MSTYSVTFNCEVITPLFLSGGDGKTPELRPPSIRGAMRWWFRALVGEQEIKRLKEIESEIFGDTTKASKIGIKIVQKDLQPFRPYNPLPHKASNFRLKGINVGDKFEVILTLREFSSKYKLETLFEIAKNTFLISTILGGFGKRARRGFGGVKISQFDEYYRSISELENKTQQLIQQTQDLIKSTFEVETGSFSKLPSYPVISNSTFLLKFSNKNYNTWDGCLRDIGINMREFKDPVFGSGSPRRASPLIIQLAKIGNFYHPVFSLFKSKFPDRYPKYDWNKINAFLEFFEK